MRSFPFVETVHKLLAGLDLTQLMYLHATSKGTRNLTVLVDVIDSDLIQRSTRITSFPTPA